MNNTTTNTDTQGVKVSKTLKEWLSTLPKNVEEQALENLKLNYGEFAVRWFDFLLEQKSFSLREAIYRSFNLDKTKEGRDYWFNVIKVHGTTENK